MISRIWTAAALAVVAVPLVAIAGVTRHAVRGNMQPVTQGGSERGRFRLLVGERSNGATFERIEAATRSLDSATEYRLFLVKSGGTDAADFGSVRVGPHGFGGFRFDTRFASLPSGVTTLSDYGGGTIEVRAGDTAVLTGSVPEFIDIGDGSGPGAAAFGHDRQALRPVDASFAGRGVILARRQDLPIGVREELRVKCGHMSSGATYTVVAIASDATETELGTFTTSDPLGIGGFRLATARGDTIPGGGVLDLAGQSVEVRDSGGIAVLTGTFPTFE
jgi:hypothetical protein